MCLFECGFVPMSVVPTKARECVGCPGTEVIDGFELPGVGCWDLKLRCSVRADSALNL